MFAVTVLWTEGWTVAEVLDHDQVEGHRWQAKDVLRDAFDSVVKLDNNLQGGEGGQVDADRRSDWSGKHQLKVLVAAFERSSGLMVDSISPTTGVEVGQVEREDHPGDGC